MRVRGPALFACALSVASCIMEPGVSTLEPEVPRASSPTAQATVASWSGAVELIPLPGYTQSRPVAVNSSGLVVGESGGPSGGRPTIWENGMPREMPSLPGAASTVPADMNDAGQVVGTANLPDRGPRAVLWEDGRIIDLGTLPGQDRSSAVDISSAGHIVGTSGRSAFLWENGRMTALPSISDDSFYQFLRVNRDGIVIALGTDVSDNDREWFVVWHDGEIIFQEPAPFFSSWVDISDAGDAYVVGEFPGAVWVWRAGVLTSWPEADWVTAVTPGGLILGWIDGQGEGVWKSGTFVPLNPALIRSLAPPNFSPGCTEISDAEHLVCEGPGHTYPFLTTLTSAAADSPSGGVSDLTVTSATASTATLSWTQVDDGTGEPAWYRLKYASAPLEDWKNATIGCLRTLKGTEIGAAMECTVEGLDAGVSYDFQLMSYRVVEGRWVGAVYSNIATEATAPGVPDPAATVVQDLEVVDATASTLTLRWTQVDDGEGSPAWYRVRYGSPLESWKEGAIGCDRTIRGTEIGEEITCTVEGLEPGVTYDLQLYSFRIENGEWAGARRSNRASGTTTGGAGSRRIAFASDRDGNDNWSPDVSNRPRRALK